MSNIKKVFFDTETTSLHPGQIAQLSFIVESEGKIETAKNYFFKVNEVDPGAEKVHGMSVEFLEEKSGGKTFADTYDEFYEYFRYGKLIAHNVKFDERFISSELWRLGVSFKPIEKQCTMQYFKDILQIPSKNPRYGKYKNPNLGELVSSLNIDQSKVIEYSGKLFGAADISFHDARFDTTAMYVCTNVYKEMIQGGTEWQSIFCKK